MSSPGADSKRRADQAADPTRDYASGHNTASGAPAGRPNDGGKPSPHLPLLRPPQADGELGRLGGFAVTRPLGQGGMGTVYEAVELMARRKVALKVMRPELTARPEARERFLREAQTAGGLEHDHVVPVYHVGEDNGVLFIAMPLLRGESLEERLRRECRGEVTSPLPIAAVLKIGRETAEGLGAAHEHHLIHRDVKPCG